MSKNKSIFVLLGPSGVGKTTIKDLVINRNKEHFYYPKSHTTRQPRMNEDKNNCDYIFIDESTFELMKQNNEFIETSQPHRTYHYGLSYGELDKTNKLIISILNYEGCDHLLEFSNYNVYPIFLYSDMETIKERLIKSGNGMGGDEINNRLETAVKEMLHMNNYAINIKSTTVDETYLNVLYFIISVLNQ